MYINRFDILSAQSSIYVSFCAPYLPLFENIHLENITSKKSQYVLHLDGFDDKSQIRNIYLKDCSFEGVEKPEINKVTGAENIRFENVTVNGEPFHEM